MRFTIELSGSVPEAALLSIRMATFPGFKQRSTDGGDCRRFCGGQLKTCTRHNRHRIHSLTLRLSPSSTADMPREPDPSTNERAFLLSALSEKTRLDGRPFDAYRPISLSFPQNPDQYGVADVRMGKTRVLCNISSEVVTPYADRKFDGVFTISCELSPMGSAAFEVGRYAYVCG